MNELIELLDFSNFFWQLVTPLLFSFADVITGFTAAIITNNKDSTKMRNGLAHKMLIILIILLSFILDLTFNLNFISKIVCIYVIIMEAVSINENLQKAGVDITELLNMMKGSVKNEKK